MLHSTLASALSRHAEGLQRAAGGAAIAAEQRLRSLSFGGRMPAALRNALMFLTLIVTCSLLGTTLGEP